VVIGSRHSPSPRDSRPSHRDPDKLAVPCFIRSAGAPLTRLEHDFGPVINERQLQQMLAAVERARERGATVLAGGERLSGPEHAGGYYVAPTLVEGAGLDSEIACNELFGPIATLHRVRAFDEAVVAANASPYGLTAAIWTASVHRAQEFVARIVSGVASVNGPTYGSEPHMPFGGERASGTGWREAGTEALDVYSDLKTVYVNHDPGRDYRGPVAFPAP
jgi:alpha-ketoglutaric semialdehyde dehydrogenase